MSNRIDRQPATITTIKAAQAIAGTLGRPSKMPGMTYGLPAARALWVPAACKEMGIPVPSSYGCPVGGVLAQVKGTTCASCYATRANYRYSNVQRAQARRASGVFHPQWADAMVFLIDARVDPADPYFRWHDSGDILGFWHLDMIAAIARRTPWVKHWLPTREGHVVAQYLSQRGDFPSNLTVRLSATKIDQVPPKAHKLTSTVHSGGKPHYGRECPAPKQGNECRDCRACWSRRVANVSYHVH